MQGFFFAVGKEVRRCRQQDLHRYSAVIQISGECVNRLIVPFSVALAVLLGTTAAPASGAQSDTSQAPDQLFNVISALDTAVFDAFNHCSAPEQLQKHASYFAPNVEFYHDTGGVTWNRQDMIANTEKYVCGHFGRELIPGSLKVFPIKDFGAIAQGTHRFCQFKTGTCEGMADFVIVWRLQDGNWQITRVLSYGHRLNETTAPQTAVQPDGHG